VKNETPSTTTASAASQRPTRLSRDSYCSNVDVASVGELLLETPGPVWVLTHAKPDGDAYGSSVALAGVLRELGKHALVTFVPPVPESLRRLPGMQWAEVLTGDVAKYRLAFEPARVVVVDTGSWGQVGPLGRLLEPWLDRTIIMDHHVTGDIAAPLRLVQPQAAACCEIIAELVEQLMPSDQRPGQRATDTAGYKHLPSTIRDALFVGIASDTGWFRFSNTRPQTHELAARLIRMGTDHAAIYQSTEQSERPEKLALLMRAVQSMQMLANGRAAMMVLRDCDFADTGALPEETERLIDIPQVVGSVRVIALVTEQVEPDGKTLVRVSFRSKPAPPGSPPGSDPGKGEDDAVDVAKLAEQFGGGGHARASGAKFREPIEAVIAKVRNALIEACC
jgi:phosphoesterase RecJ-like protein